MLEVAVGVLSVGLPLGWYFWSKTRRETPSLFWPKLAPVMGLSYQGGPPRMVGHRDGRPVLIEAAGEGLHVILRLARPTKLRFEVGPKAEVERRAGMVVPDPVAVRDPSFEERFKARCCGAPAAGEAILDPVLRQKLLAVPYIDILGQADSVTCQIAKTNDPDSLDAVIDIAAVIAAELERFPA